MSWVGINPVQMSRSVRTVLFHGQNVTAVTFWPWNSTVAAIRVYSAPDGGRKGRPKHVEHTCSC